jgi:predicted AAA+ superfamily ATPase
MDMINRLIAPKLQEALQYFPVLSLTGPRQSGKTTLVRSLFPEFRYVTLEDPALRAYANEDPRGFLTSYGVRLIIDEAQYAPELFSYIQITVDELRQTGLYILTGSQHFLMSEKITQSLAGRVAIFVLLPFSHPEILSGGLPASSVEERIFRGAFPDLYSRHTPPHLFYSSYLQTYLERDVRQLLNVGDLATFQSFMKICAGMCGQQFNMSTIAIEIGVSVPTVKRWLSVLETSFAVFLQRPYYRNFQKRLVKTPRLFFYDTGLACYLLGIQSAEQLDNYYQKGAIFENWIIAELAKWRYHQGIRPNIYYWRDSTGREVDCVLEEQGLLKLVEIKSGKTIKPEFFKNLDFLQKNESLPAHKSYVIYGGEEHQIREKATVLGWQHFWEV